jgi:hypothetical protein
MLRIDMLIGTGDSIIAGGSIIGREVTAWKKSRWSIRLEKIAANL